MIKEETSLSTVVSLESGRTLERLVQLFANISSIEQAKNDIVVYLQVSKGIIINPI